MHTSQRIKATLTSFVALTAFLPVSACDLANNYTKVDRSTNSEMQDFRDGLAPREAMVASDESSGVPELESYVAEDLANAKAVPLVSISVNQSIPLREALFELAKQADYDIELDPRISGSVIFTARNKPFDEVIDRLCEISGLRYKIVGDSLRVELDTPYSKNYQIDYLSFIRKTSSNMKTDVSVASSSGGTGGGVGGGSKFEVTSETDADFWAELDANLKQILASNSTPNFLRTAEDPLLSLTATAPTQNTPPVPPIDAAALGEVKPQAGDAGNTDYISAPQMVPATTPVAADQVPVSADTTASPTVGGAVPVDAAATPATVPVTAGVPAAQALGDGATPVPQQTTLKVESLPTALAGSADKDNSVSFTPAYSINKQAGIISVYANERVQKKVDEYLKQLQRSTTSQVLIEAKVLEVSLSDEFSSGIDWSLLDSVADIEISGSFLKPALTPSSTNLISFGISGQDVSTFVKALSRFGTVHALASPRLTVLNNQAAVLNVAKNQVYFEVDLDVERTPDGSGGFTTSTTINSDIKTVPEGILINVLPSIDLDRRMVAMQVRPTVTKITDFVNDPGVAFVASQNSVDIESQIPIVNVQEIDSVMRIKDKSLMVLGGLLQDNTTSTQEGVPVLKEIPILGGAFRNQVDAVKKTELVVFLKATILDDPSQSMHQTDRELYRTFGQDRRPEKM